MPDLYSEMMHRFCSRDVYEHYQKNKSAYEEIFNSDSDDDLITEKSCRALMHYLNTQGRCPSSPAALISYIHSNPDNIGEFETSIVAETELHDLKDFEPSCEEMDDEVLLNNLKERVKYLWMKRGLQTSAGITSGGQWADKEKTKKGPSAAKEWFVSYLAKEPFAQHEDSLLSVNTSNLQWLGVTTDEDGDTHTMRVQTFADIEMKELAWLWPGKIPSGKVTIISGKADTGKTLCLIDWTARVTTGRDWPDGSRNESGARRVLLCSDEDDPSDTTAPRLVAAGADLNKVLRLRMTVRPKDSNNEYDSVLNVKRDVDTIAKVIVNNPDISLLILDPITSYLGGANLNKDEEIRPLMNKLIALCQKTGLTILALVHSNKRSDVDAVEKVMGASSVAAGARAVWTIARDADDKTLCRMGLAKGNVIRKRSGFEYRIVDTEIVIEGKKCSQPTIQWEKETDLDANDMLAADREKSRNGGEDGKMTLAIAVLRETVPGYARDVFKKAEQEGIEGERGERLIYRAREKLGIETDKSQGKGKAYWYVPGEKGDPALRPIIAETYIPEEAVA